MADGGLAVAGVALAVPGVVDTCIKYSNFLKRKIDNYRNVEEITRLTRIVINLVRGDAHDVLVDLQAQHTESTPDELALALVQELRTLLERLQPLLPDPMPSRKTKLVFSFKTKKAIDKSCAELDDWHSRLVRHLFLRYMHGANGNAASASQSRVRSQAQNVKAAIANPGIAIINERLKLGPFDIATRLEQLLGSSIFVNDAGAEVVEYREYALHASQETVTATEAIVGELAARLHQVGESTTGLLRCNGFTSEPWKHRFALRFQYPTNKGKASTLRTLLVPRTNDRRVVHPLENRVRLARKLASAVLFMHTYGFVHKNIRADMVLVFDNTRPVGRDPSKDTYPHVIGEPFLVGFDSVRKMAATSNMIRVEEWEKNIYLHPDRHRMAEGDRFTVQHDLYSLGIVLLEIATWASFTDRGTGGMAKSLFDPADRSVLLSPEKMKARFVQIAKSKVPRIIGTKYADVVVSCLEGLKDDEQGGLLDNENGMVTGSAYVSQILTKLEEISL